MSEMHAARLVAEGFAGDVTVLRGIYREPSTERASDEVRPAVVFAGRHVLEKRIDHLIHAFALVKERRPELRLDLFGDGPERRRNEELAECLGLREAVSVLGHCPELEISDALAHASCMATASEREGYGLVVVEAAAHGTPSVVVRGPENAAVELVQEGINGAVAESADPSELAAAILRVVDGGAALRQATALWFFENSSQLRIENSIELVLEAYESLLRRREASTPQDEHVIFGSGSQLPHDAHARSLEDRAEPPG